MRCRKCGKSCLFTICRECLEEELRRLRGVALLIVIIVVALLRPIPQASPAVKQAQFERRLDIAMAMGHSLEWADAGNSWGG